MLTGCSPRACRTRATRQRAPASTYPRTVPPLPRPTTAQLAYGSLTVVLSTLATLLLSDVRSGAAVVAVAAGGLLLGLLVAVTVTMPAGARRRASLGRDP